MKAPPPSPPSFLERTPAMWNAVERSRYLRLLATLLVVWVAGGAACFRQQRVDFAAPPIVFESVPTLEELAAVVNRTDSIRKLQSNSATVTAPTMSDKSLTSTLVLERDKQFRMKGKISPLPMTIFDLGSNEEVFWLQVPNGMQQELYFARHDEFASQSQRVILPIEPTWLIDALGLVHLDPASVIEGPTRRPDGQLEVRSQLQRADGPYRRVCVINDQTGVVTEQYLYGPSNQLVARALASKHRYYEAEQCSLPHLIKVHLQPAGGPPLALEMEIGQYTINQILSGDPELFKMPQNASQQFNLATLGAALPMPGAVPPMPAAAPAHLVPPPAVGAGPSPAKSSSNGGAAPGPATAWPDADEIKSVMQMPPQEAGQDVPRTARAGYAPATTYRPALRGTTLR